MSLFTLQDMPGPSDEARQLQLRQHDALDALYDAWDVAPDAQDPAYVARRNDYDGTVAALEALLGPQAHCNKVDADLWSLFSDCYKSEHGIRPRFHQTRSEVQAYLRRGRSPAQS